MGRRCRFQAEKVGNCKNDPLLGVARSPSSADFSEAWVTFLEIF